MGRHNVLRPIDLEEVGREVASFVSIESFISSNVFFHRITTNLMSNYRIQLSRVQLLDTKKAGTKYRLSCY